MNLAGTFMNLDPKIRNGSLRIFGCWFGRPMDSFHKVVSAEMKDETLLIIFSEGETLEILEPSDIIVQGIVVKIPKAKKVKWSWYYFGKPRTKNNQCSIEYLVEDTAVLVKTKIILSDKVNLSEPAVEIC